MTIYTHDRPVGIKAEPIANVTQMNKAIELILRKYGYVLEIGLVDSRVYVYWDKELSSIVTVTH